MAVAGGLDLVEAATGARLERHPGGAVDPGRHGLGLLLQREVVVVDEPHVALALAHGLDDPAGQGLGPDATVAHVGGRVGPHALVRAHPHHEVDLGVGVAGEAVDRDDRGEPEDASDVLEVAAQVGHAVR